MKTGSEDLIGGKRKQNLETEVKIRGGADGPTSPSSASKGKGSSTFASAFPNKSRVPLRNNGFNPLLGGLGKTQNASPNNGQGLFAEQGAASGKGTTSEFPKPPRAPSGFGKNYNPEKNQGLYGSPSGSGNNGSSSSVEYDQSRPRTIRSKSSDQCINPNRFYRTQKKGKQSKNPQIKNRSTSDRILKRQEVYDRYKEFIKELQTNGYDDFGFDCPYQRFEDMCIDPKTGFFTDKVMFQAEGGLALEAQGILSDVRVNTDPSIDIDLIGELTSTGQTIFVDGKRAIKYDQLKDNFGNLVADTARTKDPKTRAFESGKKAVAQQQKWAEAANGMPIYEFYDLKDY